MVGLFSSAQQNKQIGLDFQSGGVAVVQVQSGKKRAGRLLHSEYLPAVGQQAQSQALGNWVTKTVSKNHPVFACSPMMITMYIRLKNRRSRQLN